jgi:hypothetical protein
MSNNSERATSCEAAAPSASPDGAFAVGLQACRSFLQSRGITVTHDPQLSLLAQWLLKGFSGEPVTIVTPICPDYSYESSTEGEPYYTFESVGGTIGVAGERLFETLPALHRLLSELGVRNFKHVACLGDFDGFSDETVRRVKVTREEFRACILGSREALRARAPVPLEPGLISDLCGGEAGWIQEVSDMRRRFGRNEFRHILTQEKGEAIRTERRAAYQRWYGTSVRERFIEMLVAFRAAEHATVGKLIAQAYPDALIVGVGDGGFSRFYATVAALPVWDLGLRKPATGRSS